MYRVDEVLDAIRPCLESGWTGPGETTQRFEAAWRAFTGLPHAHFVNSATAGLHLAVHTLKSEDGWQDGDEIIATPLTFVSTNHVILYERLRPVFADVDEYLCLDPESVESRITRRTRAVMFVGIGGNTGQLPEIIAICHRYNLRLILDAAHMAGTEWNGRHVGSEADATVFSFHAVKNLPTADSGMVCFRDPTHDHLCRQLTWLGITKDTYSRTQATSGYRWQYDVPRVGFKYHGNAVMAAMGLVALRYLKADNLRRRELSQIYDAVLPVWAQRIPQAPGCVSSRHLYQVRVLNRDQLLQQLNAQGIFPGVHYQCNTSYPMYAGAARCPRAERAAAELLSLPLHVGMTFDDVERVGRVMRGLR
jgi:dTDP-4-amino-4,6-dideoxygalactose transaminase